MRKYFTILLLCLLPVSLLAQSGVSTSLFTGRMSYTIPIYTIEDPDFNLDIALRYSSEGFKPFQPSGCYGQDWSLIAGGCITRQVMGLPDELQNYNERLHYFYRSRQDYKNDKRYEDQQFSIASVYRGYVYTMEDFKKTYWFRDFSKEKVFDFKLNETIYNDSLGISHQSVYNDFMPDIYHFDFCGHKGSFIINNAGESVILSGDFVSISIGNAKYSRGTTEYDKGRMGYPTKCVDKTGFITIETIDGYTYVFGYINSSSSLLNGGLAKYYDYSEKYVGGTIGYSLAINKDSLINEACPIVNAWYLAAIAAPNGRAVVFKYKRDENDVVPNNLCSFVTGYDWTKDGNESHINYSLQRDCMLESITIEDSIPLKVSFMSSPEENKMYERSDYAWGCMPHLQLDSIVVKGGDRVLRKATLSYQYRSRNTSSGGTFNWRYLDTVSISGVGKYAMEYNRLRLGNYEYPSLNPLTDAAYKGMVDRWGFWNNSPLQGMLSQVNLPTGGFIKFTYGSHEYGTERRYKKYDKYFDVSIVSVSQTNAPISGARIEKIETYSDANTLVETQTFTYKTANKSNSSGIYYNIYEIYDNPSYPCFGGKEKVQITHPYNYNLITSHIGYSYVEQEKTVGSEKSKTTFTFDTGFANYNSFAYRGSSYSNPISYILTFGETLTVAVYGNLKRTGLTHTSSDKDGIEALFEEAINSNLYANMCVAVDNDAHLLYVTYLAGYDLLWQAIFGNAIAQYSAALGLHLKHLNGKAHTRQVTGHSDA